MMPQAVTFKFTMLKRLAVAMNTNMIIGITISILLEITAAIMLLRNDAKGDDDDDDGYNGGDGGRCDGLRMTRLTRMRGAAVTTTMVENEKLQKYAS